MAFFKGNFTKTIKNTSRVLEMKTREWALESRDECVLDLCEHRNNVEERKKELNIDDTKWNKLLKELEDFK